MRVLWLSMNPGLYGVRGGNDSYNGGGWISSLQKLIEDSNAIEIGLAFLTSMPCERKHHKNTSYYPIYIPNPTTYHKLQKYYGGYKKLDRRAIATEIEHVINDFRPDVIHLFGLENEMADILGQVPTPIVVHLQGLLGPCNNAFWAQGFSKRSFMWPFSINEWILRNGYIYAKNSMDILSKHERLLFQKLRYAMGRTEWDSQITKLMAPLAQYYHVDEVLRPIFYKYQGAWKQSAAKPKQIISTISNTIYKGLDLILKTAKLLKETETVDYTWKVIGVSANEKIVKFFEENLHIKSHEVNVEYLGILSAEQLCTEELESTIYVHPSYIDNSPNSLCEAQLLGLPCISTNVGGTASIIEHKENGLLVPANAPFELAFYIKSIFESPELAIKLSTNGSSTALARHDKAKIIQDLIEAYQDICEANNNIAKEVNSND